MAEEKLEYFMAKISALDFLTGMAALYGPVTNLKFRWVEGVMWDVEGKWNAQLTGISELGMSSTGIEYEIDLWDFIDREPELEEYRKIENQFAIAKDMTSKGNSKLPLSAISVKASELQGDNQIPMETASIWLHYGYLG